MKGTYIVLLHLLLLLVPAYSVFQAVLLLLSFRQGQSGRKTSTEVIPIIQLPSIQREKGIQQTLDWDLFFPVVGPRCPTFTPINLPGTSATRPPTATLIGLSKSKGGALPAFPLRPFSLNGNIVPSMDTSGLPGYSIGMLVEGGMWRACTDVGR